MRARVIFVVVFCYFLSIYFILMWQVSGYILVPLLALTALGITDILQKKDAIRRNFPIVGRLRELLQAIRPQVQQYYVESETNGVPFNRETRALVYERAAGSPSNRSFGTLSDVNVAGHEWIDHSIEPRPVLSEQPRIIIGDSNCSQPYSASIFNISALSFILSPNALLALTYAAKEGGFFHNTGEGGVLPYHLDPGGDLVWQIGSSYIHCRTDDGEFSDAKFQERAVLKNVKMIELKLSQGAKPGFGWITAAEKISRARAGLFEIPPGKDLAFPATHSAFRGPKELMLFLKRLKQLSGGKPVGIKMCIGKTGEVFSLVKAMLETGVCPDFISVDGSEGGTGIGPLEFMNNVGTPLNEGIVLIHNALVGCGLRKHVRIIASGKVITGFDMITKLALGADLCCSARGMMFALGCIQALRCHTNTCPTGVATRDDSLVWGLHVGDKAKKVLNYHRATVNAFLELLASAGLSHPSQLRPWHINRRLSPHEIRNYSQLYGYFEEDCLLKGKIPETYKQAWDAARTEQF